MVIYIAIMSKYSF